jgi:polar amino acid transport system substrate-binding protein
LGIASKGFLMRQQKENEAPRGSRSRRYYRSITGVAVVFFVLFTLHDVGAQDHTIKLGVPPNGWPPYIIVQQDHVTGIAIDIVTTVVASLGYELELIKLPEKRGHLKTQKGLLDAWPDAIEWVENPELYLWSDPMVNSEDWLIFKKTGGAEFNRIEALFGKSIGTHLGYYYPVLEPYFSSGQIRRADTYSEKAMLRMLTLGRSDAVVMNKLVALWVMKNDSQLQASDFSFAKNSLDRAGYRIMFTRRHDWISFISGFNSTLNAIKKDGRLDRIVSAYQ